MSDPPGLTAPRLNNTIQKRNPAAVKKSPAPPSENAAATNGTSCKSSSPLHSFVAGERTVKNLRLSKALSIPEGTTVSDACRRMADTLGNEWEGALTCVDAVLLTDAIALLSGIVTGHDIATSVIAKELRPDRQRLQK